MRAFLLPAALVLLGPIGRAAQSPLPQPLPADRYEQMLEKSPFALATPPAPVVEQKAPFVANWVLSGVMPMLNEQGEERYFVSVRSKDGTERFQLFGDEPNAEGVSISAVDWSPQVGKSKVTLKKGNEFGVVEFDEMALQAAPAPVAAAQPRPGQPGAVPGGMLPGSNPAAGARGPANGRIQVPRPGSVPQPGANGAIPRPGMAPQPQASTGAPNYGAVPLPSTQANGLPTANNPAAGPTPGRRIRVINSKP